MLFFQVNKYLLLDKLRLASKIPDTYTRVQAKRRARSSPGPRRAKEVRLWPGSMDSCHCCPPGAASAGRKRTEYWIADLRGQAGTRQIARQGGARFCVRDGARSHRRQRQGAGAGQEEIGRAHV